MITDGSMEEVKAELLMRKAPIKQDGLGLVKGQEAFVAGHQGITNTKIHNLPVPVHTSEEEEVKIFLQACVQLLRS